MDYRIILLVFLFVNGGNNPYQKVFAQNLVLNPSFESILSCPLGTSELNNATDWDNPFINSIADTCSTSDLFNACNFLGAFGVGVPANLLGNEPARTGNGYAGIILSERIAFFGCTSLGGSNWREYVMGRLSTPMTAGQTYCVTFYASLADNVKFSTDDIGVHFSNLPLTVSCAIAGNGPLPATPQLVWTGGALNNANGWTELQWTFTATGGEQFITIGNFLNDGSTTVNCENAGAINPYAYYYIDDVSVVPGSCGILPVTLNYFKGEETGSSNQLVWETNSEINNDLFLIEKSEDGTSWSKWESIPSLGLDQGGSYQMEDTHPAEKTWYRLSQIDLNGDQRVLKSILVDRHQAQAWGATISPNPTHGTFSLALNRKSARTSIILYNTQGQVAWQKQIGEMKPGQAIDLNAGQLADGVYTVEIKSGVNISRQRLVILH